MMTNDKKQRLTNDAIPLETQKTRFHRYYESSGRLTSGHGNIRHKRRKV